jgi:hypothetical protein
MGKWMNVLFGLLILCCAVVIFPQWAAASSDQTPATLTNPTNLTVHIEVPDKIFWSYNYLTKDEKLAKPATIYLGWAVGATDKETIRQFVMPTTDYKSDLVITTEKNASVNVRIFVRDATNVELGSLSLQIRNHGQTESFTLAPPIIPNRRLPTIINRI